MTNEKQNRRPLSGGIRRFKLFLRSNSALRLAIIVLGIALITGLFEVAIVPVRYNLQVGMVPTSTISATKDVEDTVATENRRAQAAAAVSPTYFYQEGVTEQVMADFDTIFNELRLVHQYGATLPDQSPNRSYTKEELQYAKDMLDSITLWDYQITALLNSTLEELENAYSLLYTALQSTMQIHVTEGQTAAAVSSIRQIVDYRMSIRFSQYLATPILNACIKPNMLIDQEATEKARAAARDAVEPVIYKQGQNIVVRGEGRITQSQLNMLSTLGLLTNTELDMPTYLGAALMVVMVLTIMFLALRNPQYHIVDSTSRLLILLIIMAITLGFSILARMVHAYLAPALLCSLLVTALLGMRPGLIVNVAMTVLISALAAGGSEAYAEQMVTLITAGLISGTASALLLGERVTRLKVLLAGLLGCLMNFLVMLAMGLMTASELTNTLLDSAWLVGGSLIGMLLCIGLQPLFETIFNLPTTIKLLELSNPNHPLMRRLLLEAPGTYHHSIIVANLSEAAAEAIHADPLLARVGGYYHDIGKLKRPLYFKENQSPDDNAHDRTDPYVSAAILTSHTRDGVALAKASHLPQAVINIIAEHHGNTPVMFFYHKALQMANGKPVDINAFRYDSHPPRTKEGAIVLLCDTIEAAVRSMKNPTPEAIEEFIVKLIRGKLEDGQLSDSPLTLQDIDKIGTAVTQVLAGVFHERIEYPDMEKERMKNAAQAKRRKPDQDSKKNRAQADAPASQDAADTAQKTGDPNMPERKTDRAAIAESSPAPKPLPVDAPAPETNDLHVEIPDAEEGWVKVAPLPTIAPVSIDQLMTFEPLPTKEQAEAENIRQESAQDMPGAEAGKSEEENAAEAGETPDARTADQPKDEHEHAAGN